MAKILLVEDDPMISEIYQRKFESSGFDVGIAATGKEALKKAREEKYDIILLDLVLPEMDGMEVLKEIKQSGKYSPETKVVIFSNLTEKENQEKALENGADGFISKSQFSPSNLVEEVKRILGEYLEQQKNSERMSGSVVGNDDSEKGKRILFIEDEDVFAEMFGKKLESEGYNVEYAKNGAWGLKEALNKNFDLIIMDMVMPAMSGIEMLERLKLEEKTKNIPIIALSASLEESELARVKEMGVEDYYIKTRIVPSDLAKRVKEILG